jgi:hypothetical protein
MMLLRHDALRSTPADNPHAKGSTDLIVYIVLQIGYLGRLKDNLMDSGIAMVCKFCAVIHQSNGLGLP